MSAELVKGWMAQRDWLNNQIDRHFTEYPLQHNGIHEMQGGEVEEGNATAEWTVAGPSYRLIAIEVSNGQRLMLYRDEALALRHAIDAGLIHMAVLP